MMTRAMRALAILLGASGILSCVWAQQPQPDLQTQVQTLEGLAKTNPPAAYSLAAQTLQAATEEENIALQAKVTAITSAIYIRLNKLDSTAYFARRSLNLALSSGDSLQIADSYNQLGNAFEATGRADSALTAYSEGLRLAKLIDVPKTIIKLSLNVGMIQRTLGRYPESLALLLAARDQSERDSIYNFLPNILLSLGELYVMMGEEGAASDYLYQALEAARKAQSQGLIARSIFALGAQAKEGGDTLEALCWYQEALAFAQAAGLRGVEAKASAEVAQVYAMLGQLDRALPAAQAAVQIAEQDRDVISMGLAYEVLGFVYLKSKRYDQAFQSCGKANSLAQELGQFNAIANTCDCLWRSAAGAGRYKEAFQYYQQYVHWQDSLTGAENAYAIARIEERNRFEHQHTADSLVQLAKDHRAAAAHEAEMHAEQLKSERILLAGIGVMALGLLAAGGLVIFRRQARRLHAQNVLIQSQNRSIQQALDDKEVLLREVHHRVKNNLQIMISLLDIQADQTDGQSPREILQASKGRVQSMSLIHQKLYQQEHMAALHFDVYLRQLATEIQAMFQTQGNVALSFELEECALGIDQAVPLGLILNELLTNAYKYAFVGRQDGRLRLSLRRAEGQRYSLVVEDDGPGMPANWNAAASSSLGINLIRGLSRQLRAQFSIEKSEWGGAKFVVNFEPKTA